MPDEETPRFRSVTVMTVAATASLAARGRRSKIAARRCRLRLAVDDGHIAAQFGDRQSITSKKILVDRMVDLLIYFEAH